MTTLKSCPINFKPSADPKLIKMPKKPKGADWNSPPIEIDDMVYRYDGGGYKRSGNNQIFILPVEGGTPRQVSSLDKNPGSAVWLGSDKLLFSANLHDDSDFEPNNSEIHVLDINSGEVKQLTTRFGPDSSPVVSPDKSKIAFLGYDDKYLGYQQNSLYVMGTDGSNVKLVSEGFDRNISNINWMRDGKASAGVIAQDVEEVLPSAVKEVENMDKTDTHKVVDYNQLSALFIEAIKELKEENKLLRAEIESLKDINS